MGWCAIDFCNEVWDIVKKYIPKDKKTKVARAIYDKFRDYDMDDCCGDTEIEKYVSPDED